MTPLGTYVLQTLTALTVIVALALIFAGMLRRAQAKATGDALELVARLPLDPRRSIVLVRVASRIYVLGVGEAGIAKLGELERDELPSQPTTKGASFADVLQRIRAGTLFSTKGESVAEVDARDSGAPDSGGDAPHRSSIGAREEHDDRTD